MRSDRALVAVLTGACLLCAAVVAAGWAPARALAGAVLACYLPGRLALAALRPVARRSKDTVLDNALAVALSLVVLMVVGAVLAAGRIGFSPARAALVMAALCAGIGGVAWRRTPANTARDRAWPRPSTGDVLAALPALALTGVLIAQIAGFVHHRSADSYYTELSATPSPTGMTVRVHNMERTTVDYRYEERRGGVLTSRARFTLAPGAQGWLAVATPGADRVEIRLFRGAEPGAYRRLILGVVQAGPK